MRVAIVLNFVPIIEIDDEAFVSRDVIEIKFEKDGVAFEVTGETFKIGEALERVEEELDG